MVDLVHVMHSYATDSPEKRYIPFFLAAGAIAATFGLSKWLTLRQIDFPWWLSSPVDTMAFYGALYFIFDRWLWRVPILHRLKVVRAPHLAGRWTGEVRTTASNGGGAPSGDTSITVDIRQTWSQIAIVGRTTQSQFHSLSASLITADECSMSYEYVNEPSAAAVATMHAHRGTAMLNIDPAHEKLEGEYYSGRDRQTIGMLVLRRAGH